MRVMPATFLLACALRSANAQPPETGATEGTRIFSLVEKTERGKLLRYPAASVADVDVNSSVLIQVDRAALRPPAGGPVASPDVARIELLRRIQDDLNKAARDTLEQVHVAGQARAGGARLSPDELKAYQAAFSRLNQVLGMAKAYLESTRGKDGTAEYRRLSEMNPSNPVPALLDFFAREHESVQQKLRERSEASGATRTLELTAWLGSPPTQVHLPGYDNLSPGEARIVDKTRFVFDDRFQAEYEAAKRLAATAAESNGLKQAALEAIRLRLEALASGVREVNTRSEAVQRLLEAARAGDDLVRKVKTLVDKTSSIAKKLAPPVEAALNPQAGADPAKLLQGVVSALEGAFSDAEEAYSLLQQIQDGAASLAKDVPELAETVQAVGKDLRLVMGVAADSTVASVPALATLQVRLEDARDTELALIQTSRTEGDVVAIRGRVIENDRVVAGGEQVGHLRVRSSGFVADVGAAVLFVRPVAADPGPFVPSAGAYAVFRFKGWRGDGEARAGWLQNVAPGLGVCFIAIPDNSRGSATAAWLGTAHLFGDILQAGFGVTPEAKPVWGFGFGLHQIAGIGKYW
jgi:hypothetical protein